MCDDWLEHTDLLPPRPRTFIEEKYKMYFALDVGGIENNDQYVFVAPNGLAVIGLAPSHALVKAHRESTGYQPLPLQYIPPDLPQQDIVYIDEDEEGGPPPGASRTLAEEGDDDEAAGTAGAADEAAADNNTEGGAAAGDRSGQQETSTSGTKPCPAMSAEELTKVNFNTGRHDWSQTKLSGKRKNQGVWLERNQTVCKIEGSGGQSVSIQAIVKGKLLEVNQQLMASPKLVLDRPCREGYIAILLPHLDHVDKCIASLTTLDDYLKLRDLTREHLL